MGRGFIRGAIIAALFNTTAQAADFSETQTTDPFTWSGFYTGAHGGYAWSPTKTNRMRGGFGGAQLGANYQLGHVVAGLEADFSGGYVGYSEPFLGTDLGSRIDYFGTARGRLGLAFDRLLFYGTGGYAFIHNISDGMRAGIKTSVDRIHSGWAAGGGIEFAITDNFTVKAEYLYAYLYGRNYTFFDITVPFGDADYSMVKLGLNVSLR